MRRESYLAQGARAALLVDLARRERQLRSPRPRVPEPMALNTIASVDAFHAAGAEGGPMLAFYEASARSISRLLPPDGLVLDLGCGSARCATYFARRRPDATVIGIDVADAMLRQGHSLVRQKGLADRVELRSGDMCDLGSLGSIRPAVVSATLSLHHLPGLTQLRRCVRGIAEIVDRTGCGVWLFDLARLRDAESYRELLEATPAFAGVCSMSRWRAKPLRGPTTSSGTRCCPPGSPWRARRRRR